MSTTAASFGLLRAIRTCFVLDHSTRAVLANKVATNCTTDTPILHVEASFISAERGLCRGSWVEPLSNVAFILASFQSSQFSFANNSKGLWLLAQCMLSSWTLLCPCRQGMISFFLVRTSHHWWAEISRLVFFMHRMLSRWLWQSSVWPVSWQHATMKCNALICLQLAMHRVSSCGTHRVVTHSRKTRFSAHRTSCATTSQKSIVHNQDNSA